MSCNIWFLSTNQCCYIFLRRDTCGTRRSYMCATSDPSLVGQCCCVYGAKFWLRFNQLCCYILATHLCDFFYSYWRLNQFIWRFKFEFELITNNIFYWRFLWSKSNPTTSVIILDKIKSEIQRRKPHNGIAIWGDSNLTFE